MLAQGVFPWAIICRFSFFVHIKQKEDAPLQCASPFNKMQDACYVGVSFIDVRNISLNLFIFVFFN
jgi:hypothetical protein